MVKYSCHLCGKKFDRKTTFKSHISRKNSCIKNKYGSKTNKKIPDPKCKDCGRSFSRRDSLIRHIKICKGDIYKTNIKGTKNTTVNGTKNNTNINSPTYNINFIDFGKDGINGLDLNDFIEIARSNSNPYETLIKIINFDPKKPQHHNIYYTDTKASCGQVYENKKWVEKKINEIVNILLDAKTEDFNSMLDKLGDDISKKTRENIINTIKDVDYSKPIARKKLISYLKPVLANNSDMVLKTKKLLEEYNADEEYADEEVFKKGIKIKDIKKRGLFNGKK